MGTGASENQVSRRRQAIVKILRAAVIMAVVFFIMPINVCAATSDTEFFNEEQYKFLKECVEKDDIATWNAWRENASQDRVLLSEADLQGAHLWEANLQGAILGGAKLQGAYLEFANLQGAHLQFANLQGAHLRFANLQGAYLGEANLQGAYLWGANLQGAHLWGANLQGADLRKADLQGASLWGANLQGADLREADLQGADLWGADLQGADLMRAKLQGAHLWEAKLQGVKFIGATLDSSTNLLDCAIDGETDFTATALDSVKILPETLTALKTNIRRFSWERWYEEHPIQAIFVRPFWRVSDYGSNTLRIFCITLVTWLFFAIIYPLAIIIFNIRPLRRAYRGKFGGKWLIKTLKFGTKTSLNSMLPFSFGRVELDASDWEPLTLMILNGVIFLNKFAGYVLFACLLTRLGILFTSLSP